LAPLAKLAQVAVGLASPAIIVVGDVVRFAAVAAAQAAARAA
jgi:siroheme synthase